ncbi:PIN domain-containing protein [Sabulibacter ruber]|uniref:PIN domain-containing protein n=1 Tax=Sabulibacter ruber TaxID=2811901 RepID=UPI001A95AD56|nr:PIN domain-containing protein [Sabulibacter ruber]
MSRLVLIDSQLFIWGIKGEARPEQFHKIAESKRLLDWLQERKYKILLPVPQMVELLSCANPSEQQAIKDLFDRRFRIVPFDSMAAEVCAELLYDSYNDKDLIAYRKEHKVTKGSIKYDCMLVAVAITNRVEVIYSTDPDLKRYANGRIHVSEPPFIPEPSEIGKQLEMFPMLGSEETIEETPDSIVTPEIAAAIERDGYYATPHGTIIAPLSDSDGEIIVNK